MKKEQEEPFSPFGSYERYTPKLKLPGIAEKKQENQKVVPKNKKLSKRDIILIILIISGVAVTLYFMLNSNQGEAIDYTKASSWIIEHAACSPQELQVYIRNFSDEPIPEGEWVLNFRSQEYSVILEEPIAKGNLKTLIFYFEQSSISEGINRFRLYSPDMEYFDGECTV